MWEIVLYANSLFILVCVKPNTVPITNENKQLKDKLIVQVYASLVEIIKILV